MYGAAAPGASGSFQFRLIICSPELRGEVVEMIVVQSPGGDAGRRSGTRRLILERLRRLCCFFWKVWRTTAGASAGASAEVVADASVFSLTETQGCPRLAKRSELDGQSLTHL